MMASAMQPTERFSDRVADYVRGRPGYPESLLDALAARFGLAPAWTIADVGSGTGIFSRMLLARGCSVAAVEPNEAMRRAAEGAFRDEPRFRSVAGTAEATTLAPHSVNAVVAAQAFHWFDRAAFRAECTRVLVPGGLVALVWNVRRPDASEFARGYEALIRDFATDYLKIRHENVSDEDLAAFFGGPFERRDFGNVQSLDFDGLTWRLRSSSYLPAADQPRHAELLATARRLFEAHEKHGRIDLPYDARVYAGRLAQL